MRALAAEIARFGLVGLAATLAHTAAAWAAHRAGAPPYAANALGFAAAVALSYLGHFYWTFARRAGHRSSLPRFVATSAAGFALSNLIVWAVVTRGGYPFEAALLVILATVPPATWALARLWAFRG